MSDPLPPPATPHICLTQLDSAVTSLKLGGIARRFRRRIGIASAILCERGACVDRSLRPSDGGVSFSGNREHTGNSFDFEPLRWRPEHICRHRAANFPIYVSRLSFGFFFDVPLAQQGNQSWRTGNSFCRSGNGFGRNTVAQAQTVDRLRYLVRCRTDPAAPTRVASAARSSDQPV